MHHLKSILFSVFSLALLAGILWSGGGLEAQQANDQLVIEPNRATLSITSDETVQLNAIYQDSQDVTDDARWSWGFTSDAHEGLEMVSPGEFKSSGTRASQISIFLTYQDPNTGEFHSANAIIEVTGGVNRGGAAWAPLDRNIVVGEEIELSYFIDSGGICDPPPCRANFEQQLGSWFSRTPDILQSFGAGLFQGLKEGYGEVRVVTSSGRAAEQYVGVEDPTKPFDGSFDVSLVNRRPVYTWVDAKYHDNGGTAPFTNIEYIPGTTGEGFFVVLGECADGRRVGSAGRTLHETEYQGGGMYVLDTDGNFIEKQDVCHDTTEGVYSACYEGGGCVIGKDVSLVDNGRFILDTGEPRDPRSPVLYSIDSFGAASVENRLFFSDRERARIIPSEVADVLMSFKNLAYASGVMVGVGEESLGFSRQLPGFPGPSSRERKNIFYSVPEFQRLAEMSTPTTCPSGSCSGSPVLTQEVYTPIFGLGEYFVTGGNTPPFSVYRMPSRAELRNGQMPEKVQDLDPGHPIQGMTRDVLDSNRLLVFQFSGSSNELKPYTIYEPGENGLEVVEQGNLDGFPPSYGVALRGDYIAYQGECGDHPNPPGGILNTFTCELVVEKDGEHLSVEPLPLNIFSPRSWGPIPGVEISPAGTILVSMHNMRGIHGENDNLYLYQITDFDGRAPIFDDPGFGDGGGGGFGDFFGGGSDFPNTTGDQAQEDRSQDLRNYLNTLFRRLEAFFGPLNR